MNKNDITIRIDNSKLKRTEAVANIMGISAEKLTEEALDSFLYTVREHLRGIEEHAFPQQIMFD